MSGNALELTGKPEIFLSGRFNANLRNVDFAHIRNIFAYFMPLFFNLAISCTIGGFFFLALCQMFNLLDILSFAKTFIQKHFKKQNKIKTQQKTKKA